MCHWKTFPMERFFSKIHIWIKFVIRPKKSVIKTTQSYYNQPFLLILPEFYFTNYAH